MATRTERTEVIETLEKQFAEASGIYLTDFNKINVDRMTKLRAEIRNNGGQYVVVKNTLAQKAFEKCGLTSLVTHLKGPTGIALIKGESVAPARSIRDFKKENKDLLEIKAAYVDGTLIDGNEVLRIADLPSKEVLLSQLLSCLNAPMTNFAGSLKGILTKFVATLEDLRNKKESQGS